MRYFTVNEANAMLPEVRGRLEACLVMRGHLRGLHSELSARGHPPPPRGTPDLSGPPEVAKLKARYRGLFEAMSAEVDAITSDGVQIKDLETGLIDFPARMGGRDVLLCWKLGEPKVAFYHGHEEGFRGRKPLTDEACQEVAAGARRGQG